VGRVADCFCTGFFSASSGDSGGGSAGGATSSGDGCLGAGCTRASGESAGSLKMIDFELDMNTFFADASDAPFTVGLTDVLGSGSTFGLVSLGTTTAADFEPGKIVRDESNFATGAAFGLERPGSRPPARTYTNPLPNNTAPARTPAFTANGV
jgi:hypothetical protein